MPDDNLPHLRISLACTTCIAQALCSREIFYHICVHLASVFSKKSYFSFLFSPHGLLAHFLCILHTAFHIFAWKTPLPLRMHRNGALYTKRPSPSGPAGFDGEGLSLLFLFQLFFQPIPGSDVDGGVHLIQNHAGLCTVGFPDVLHLGGVHGYGDGFSTSIRRP